MLSSKLYSLSKEARHIANGYPLSEQLRHEADREFIGALEKALVGVAIDKAFFVKLAGCSHRNVDGSSRSKAIEYCEPLDQLELRAEPENGFDPNAIAVIREKTGEQLGYLDAHTAQEITSDNAKYGPRWLAVFRHANVSPETGHIVGAVVYLLRVAGQPSAG